MKKSILALLIVLALASGSSASSQLGVGVAGGLDYPLVQDDQTSGPVLGARLIWSALPTITIEPNIFFTRYGDGDFSEFGGDLDGMKVNAYGVDATLGGGFRGAGFSPFLVAGLALYNMDRDLPGDQVDVGETKLGWSGGLGLGIGLGTKLQLDTRGQFVLIPIGDGGSRKSVNVLVGLNLLLGN